MNVKKKKIISSRNYLILFNKMTGKNLWIHHVNGLNILVQIAATKNLLLSVKIIENTVKLFFLFRKKMKSIVFYE